MNQQEAQIAVWRAMHQQMTDACAMANVETQLQRERADALAAEVDKLKKEKDDAKAIDPIAGPAA